MGNDRAEIGFELASIGFVLASFLMLSACRAMNNWVRFGKYRGPHISPALISETDARMQFVPFY